MNSFRRHRRSIAGLVASLFLAVWAGMVMAPCLMAAEPILGGLCPHCPEPPPPCHDDGGAGCTYVDGYDFDGRTPAVPKVGLQLVALLAPQLAATALPEGPSVAAWFLTRAPPHPGGPSLHLRNCVLRN
jgi:hypothetical protein